MNNSNIRWWDIISKICMETGNILFLNGTIIRIFKKNKLIKSVTVKLSKTKIIVPAFCPVLSSISVSLLVELFDFLKNSKANNVEDVK